MCFEFCFMCSVKVILTELKLVLVECAVESCWCTLKDCSGSWRDAAWDGFKWRMMFTGSTGAGQSSASHSEMVYPGHHGATSERFQTVAHRLQDFAAWQGQLRITAELCCILQFISQCCTAIDWVTLVLVKVWWTEQVIDAILVCGIICIIINVD